MAITIGPKGVLDIVSSEAGGPQRKVRIIAFPGRGTTGAISQPRFQAGEKPIAIIDVNYGRLVTDSFDLAVSTGSITQSDTGGLGDDGSMSGHTMFAIITDTGTAGL
jgi:hypothetical protein